MKTILVTGGAGFIGSNFIKYMLDKYKAYRIVNLDVLTYAGNLENLKEIEEGDTYKFIKGDICDRELLEKIFEKENIQWVVNFAAESHVDRSIDGAEVFVKTNVMGTQTLLEVAKKIWTVGKNELGYPVYKNGTRFHQISTDEVYGTMGEGQSATEETPLNPRNPYSASKAAADMMVKSYFTTYKMPITITRCSNNYGPNQNREKLIPLMIHKCINGEKMPVYGDGMNIRDWIHVEDHCSAIECVLHRGKCGEVYNIGGNNERTNIQIVKMIIESVRKEINNDASLDQIQYVKDRLGHDRRYSIDNTKIVKELGWSYKEIIEERMISLVTNGYKESENGNVFNK